jgi:putative membrane protein
MEKGIMRTKSLAAALCSIALVACAKGDKSGADTTTAKDSSAASASTATTPAAPTLTDANIAALLDEANAADSANGKIASTKGTNADAKAFGVLMMNDHHALRKSGQDLVKKLNVTPTPPANDSLPMMAKSVSDSLQSMSKGAAWDKWYIDHEVDMHQKVLALIDQASSAAQAPELKDLLGKARPNIEMHLKRAQDIQSKLPAADSTKKP